MDYLESWRAQHAYVFQIPEVLALGWAEVSHLLEDLEAETIEFSPDEFRFYWVDVVKFGEPASEQNVAQPVWAPLGLPLRVFESVVGCKYTNSIFYDHALAIGSCILHSECETLRDYPNHKFSVILLDDNGVDAMYGNGCEYEGSLSATDSDTT